MRLLWNEKHNLMAFYTKYGDLGKLHVLDDDYDDENDFVCYPLQMLIELKSWVDLGEL
jgi:hypothetical protein